MIVKRTHLISKKNIARNTHFFVRMPNWLGDVIMAIPVLHAVRAGRPDVRFTFVCKSQFIPLLEKFVVKSNHHIVTGDHEDIKKDLKSHKNN